MSYTKQEFKSGDKLYASDLNKMDEQIYQNTEDISKLLEDIANLNVPTVADILNALPTWQGGAY